VGPAYWAGPGVQAGHTQDQLTGPGVVASDQAGLGLGTPADRALDTKTDGGTSAGRGPGGDRVTGGLPATGATEDEITGVPLGITPVIGLGRITGAV
jgi:hypothetical protein